MLPPVRPWLRAGHHRNDEGGSSIAAPGGPSVQTVFSADGSRYQAWQAELLAYSHCRAGQPGPLTRLCSARQRPTGFAGATVWLEPYSPHPISGDAYAPYNKPAALAAWLAETCPVAETVLLLDPDCVFLAPLAIAVEEGQPISQPISYMNPRTHPGAELIARHCRRPELVQGVGLPTLIHRADLARIVPLWLAKTEAIRADPASRKLAGWTAEMWGYLFAAAEHGLHHQERELSAFQAEDRADLPIVHYCYDSTDPTGRWRWSKRDYRAWEPVPPPPPGTPRASVMLIELLNECAMMQRRCLEG